MSNSQNYPLFNHWLSTINWLMDRAEAMPKHVRFTLSNRIVAHSLDIQELITRAIYTQERKILLGEINRKLELLRILLRICHQRSYLSTRQYQYAAEQVDAAGRMVGGWLKLSK